MEGDDDDDENPALQLQILFQQGLFLGQVREIGDEIVIGNGRSWNKDTRINLGSNSNVHSLKMLIDVMTAVSAFPNSDHKNLFHCLGSETSSSQINHFQTLPNEAVVHIFSFLDPFEITHKVSRVCKRFGDLSRDPSLWTEIRLTHKDEEDDELDLFYPISILIERSTLLRSISLGEREDSVTLALKALRHCPALEELLEISMTEASDKTLEILLHAIKKSNSFKSLGLCGRRRDVFLAEKAHCLRNLTRFSIGRSGEAANAASNDGSLLDAVAVHCKRLKSFRDAVSFPEKSVVNFLTEMKERITFLDIGAGLVFAAGFEQFSQCHKLSAVILRSSNGSINQGLPHVTKLPELRSLQVTSLIIGTLNNSSVLSAFTVPNKLSSLVIDCKKLEDTGLISIAKNCPGLKLLHIVDCFIVTDEGLRCLFEYCLLLEDLALPDSCSVTTAAFEDCGVNLKTLRWMVCRKRMRRVREMVPSLRKVECRQ